MTRIALSLLLALGCECGSSELELDDRTADRQAEQAAAELAIEQAAEQAAAEQAIEQAATEQAATEHAATEQPTEEAGTSPGAPPLPPTAVLGDAPLCEASALVRLGRQFLVADNEVHDRLFRFGRRMEPLGIVPMPPSDHPRDLEAMAYNGQNLLLIGSHSPRADGTRRDTRHRLRLVRVVANQLVPISASETGPVETSRERCLTELFGVEPTANAQAFCDALVRAGSMNIEGATVIAQNFGLSDSVIGLTLVAVGTSLPELATTVMAALRRQADVALGNVIGSNLFNLLGIIGVATLVGPIPVDPQFLRFDLWIMVGAALLMIPFVFFRLDISRLWGIGLTAAYVAYVWVIL